MTRRTAAMGAGIVAMAVAGGFAAAAAVIVLASAALPPFQPSDDDTLREFVPVALSYLTGAVTASLIGFLGWRGLRRSR